MLDQLEQIEHTFEELTARLVDPDVLRSPARFRDTSRALAELNPVVEIFHRYKRTREELDQTRELLGELDRDDDLFEVATEEERLLQTALDALEEKARQELAPRDPDEKRNAVLEIRAGAGGDEATLFAAELFRMYCRFADAHGWKVDILDLSESGIRGVKEVSAIVEGRGAFATLRYEAGVHRVATGAGDGSLGAHPHLGGHRRRVARSGGHRDRDRAVGPAGGHLLRLRPRRSGGSTRPIRRCG